MLTRDTGIDDMLIEPFAMPDQAAPASDGREHVGESTSFAGAPATEAELIAHALAWCAELFGTESARLVRPLPSGHWAVMTHRRDGVLAYAADYAEVAMAWMVGLSRHPMIVTRPRVANRDGDGVRPISAKTYVGIPLMCQDQLIGVIEIAGDLPADLDASLARAQPRLTLVAQRLIHDPGLRPAPFVEAGTRCALDGGAAFGGEIVLAGDELRFLAALSGVMTIEAIAAAAGLDLPQSQEIAAGLLARGLLTLAD